ncbi:hypothetical protein OSC52_14555 [Clostridium pasteurianum]|uniref:hypothetical protein n=1 Tax=Clostridium pasteurianum TaxID=1501 RepID=UPI002260DF3B|nr:hypothetical protein [Clostridium pasteurianum]UZW13062.1 hypothetical protein OSC52_14555 [Clostridium pasteurianum]
MEATSKWKSEADYKSTLASAMNNVKDKDGNWSHVVQTWEFNEDDIFLVKQYVTKNGMGNFKSGNALEGFLRSFSKNITKK